MVAIIIVTFMLMGTGVWSAPGKLGASVFRFMAWLAFLYCLIEGARNTADCLSEEKRAGTLGLLFLTDLKGYDVVFGKMMATSLNSIYVLIAILPPLAIPMLLGGVTGGEFWRLVLVLMVTLFLSLAVGLFVSALSRDGQRAWTTAYLVLLLLALLAIPAALAPGFNAFTPTAAFLGLADLKYRANPDNYWASVLGIGLLSVFLFAAASYLLPRVWQERSIPAPIWARRLFTRATRTQDRERRRTGHRLLNLNPVAWAAERNASNPVYLWFVAGTICTASVTLMILEPGTKSVGQALLISAIVIHFLISVWLASDACHLFARARQSGSLELLLCTPVTVKEIIEGYWRALHRSFSGPVILLVATEIILCASYIYARGPSGIGPAEAFLLIGVVAVLIVLFFLDLHAVGRYGMWMGLKSRKAGVAVTKTVGFVLLLPLLATVPCFIGLIFFPIGLIVKDLIFINYAQDQLARRFRKVATEAAGLEAARLRPARLPPVLP